MRTILKVCFYASLVLSLPTMACAQISQLATLLHDGAVTLFYGSNGFVEAVDAASDGDVITLSSGVFASPQIKKSLVIRGNGIKLGLENEPQIGTTLTSGLSVHTTENEAELDLYIEGIDIQKNFSCNTKGNVTFNKCRINGLSFNNSGYKTTFLQSEVQGNFNPSGTGSITAINSVIQVTTNIVSSAAFTNCVLSNTKDNSSMNFSETQFTNCIIDLGQRGKVNKDGAALIDCIVRTGNAQNCEIDDSSMLVDLTTPLYKSDSYYIPDDNILSFMGNDGTEIGIYGGELPFNTTINGPTISKFNVSPKSSADGKLSIDFELKAAE